MSRFERIERKLERKITKPEKVFKTDEDRKVCSEVFDKSTLLTLYDLANRGVIDTVNGPVSTGKEANIFRAYKSDNIIALKIYRIATSDFRTMWQYISGDPRFTGTKKDHRHIVYTWAKKEFRNLEKAAEVRVYAPKPFVVLNNVLVMQFIGDKKGNAAPLMKDSPPENPEKVLDLLLKFIKKLYVNAELVHADISEYNVLMFNDKPILIDWGQAVTIEHPMAESFLERDVRNILRYFRDKLRISVPDEKEALRKIRGEKVGS
ncbi:MAG: serine protein kinase RIO [Euryarchaeota archaeon]|nr:serine protein kinase RIO [Euryarchaeota archaeon]